jgi:hypothetical protein
MNTNEAFLSLEFAICRTCADILKMGSIYFLMCTHVTRTLMEEISFPMKPDNFVLDNVTHKTDSPTIQHMLLHSKMRMT